MMKFFLEVKKHILVLGTLTLVLIISCSCNNKKKLDSSLITNPMTASDIDSKDGMPEITFKTTEHDFGDILTGETIKYSFKFKNTGKGDLIISAVKATCGCTIPKFSTDPVKPGGEGYIDVTFDSKGIFGFQNKSITVVTNTIPNSYNLYLRANVKRSID
ncbi:MAG: DUF1573 domain-containing protein [Bacteroidales bacterium]